MLKKDQLTQNVIYLRNVNANANVTLVRMYIHMNVF